MARVGAKNQTEISGKIIYGHDGTNAYPTYVSSVNDVRVGSTLHDVARGIITSKTAIHIIGANEATSTSFEDMWEGSTSDLYVFPAAGGIQMEVVSTSDLDSDSGGTNPQSTGVRIVMLHYLNANYEEKIEFITMDGTNPVNTVTTDILRVQNLHSHTAGSGGVAVGTITLENTDSSVEYTRIRVGINTSLTGVWTVPADKTLYITEWETGAIATNANRTAEFFLRATSNFHGSLLPGVFNVKDIIHLTAGSIETTFDLPIKIPAKADVKVTVKSSAAMETACHIEGWYE